MTKWNPTTICEIMNARFNSKMGDNRDGFEVEGNNVVIIDIDRGQRTDHGGPDGDGWMGSTEINKCMKPFLSKYMGRIKIMERDLKEEGFDGKVRMDYGEKGHISLYIMENENNPVIKRNPPKTKKADPKPETKKAGKLNQTDQIRAYIKSGKSHKSMIQGLAKAFDKKETWAKSRIATYEKAYGNMGINDPKMAK